MDCFLKHIEHYDDPGVQGLRGDRFVPFTVLGFSGFNDPPSPKEAQFLIDVTFELAAPRNTLVVCRNALPDEERFVDDAEGVLRRVVLPHLAYLRVWRVEPRFYVSETKDRIQLARLLSKYWGVWDGNWLLFDWDSDTLASTQDERPLGQGCDNVSAMRADILYNRTVSVLTYDDVLFDVYAKHTPDRALGVVRTASENNGLAITYVQE